MHKTTLPPVFGVHTAARDSLPPNIIAVGDRRRVELAAEVLGLKEQTFIDDDNFFYEGLKGIGRVRMLSGLFEHQGRAMPLLVTETQMGMAATQINLHEIIDLASVDHDIQGQRSDQESVHVIRAGTSGLINHLDHEPVMKAGDLVNGTFSLGWSGAAMQSLGALAFNSSGLQLFRQKWHELGLKFTDDNVWPITECSAEMIAAIAKASEELGITAHQGGNFSKESLYAEVDEDSF